MSDAPVVFERVWKKFRRGERHDSLRDLIPSMAKSFFRRRPADELESEEFWALKDVSFEVKRGDAVGIIGPNGAGKSTTLKLLTKILRPTRGTAAVRGRVGALIEVAAGFHADLTGTENVFLQGAIMGMKRAEIARKLEDIVEFAGVREFIDTPVKRYSSGMQARLGFSIAAHLDPDVLIIDEVLSVGDMAFQERCLERMRVFKREGVTIVFVSHNLQAVEALCDTALYLHGDVRAFGPTSSVLETYVRSGQERRSSANTDGIEIVSTSLLGSSDRDSSPRVSPGTALTLRATYRVSAPLSDITFGFVVYRSTDRLIVYDGHILDTDIGVGALAPGNEITIDYAFLANLTRGQYHVECHVWHNPTHRFLVRPSPAALLTIDENRSHQGIADLHVRPRVVDAVRSQ